MVVPERVVVVRLVPPVRVLVRGGGVHVPPERLLWLRLHISGCMLNLC